MTAPFTGKPLTIHEFTADGAFLRTLTINRHFELVGAFARDEVGQYYILYGKQVAEHAHTEHNIAVVKYDATGKQIALFSTPAQTTGEKWSKEYSGVKIPFDAGTAKMELSGNKIGVYFAREMFVATDGKNHQASYGFILDKHSLNRLSDTDSSSVKSRCLLRDIRSTNTFYQLMTDLYLQIMEIMAPVRLCLPR